VKFTEVGSACSPKRLAPKWACPHRAGELQYGVMPKKFRTSRFALKEDCQLIAVAQTKHSTQFITEKMCRRIATILQRAARLHKILFWLVVHFGFERMTRMGLFANKQRLCKTAAVTNCESPRSENSSETPNLGADLTVRLYTA
jgi:hypothetical protein